MDFAATFEVRDVVITQAAGRERAQRSEGHGPSDHAPHAQNLVSDVEGFLLRGAGYSQRSWSSLSPSLSLP
jgi:hypothetical protein